MGWNLCNRIYFRRIYTQNRKLIQYFVCLYILTFFIILPVLCRNVKHSIYHRQQRNSRQVYQDVKQENEVRLEKSLAALEKYRHYANDIKRRSPSWDSIGITIVTTSRSFPDGFRPRYLTQAAGALLELVSLSPSRMNYTINVCNVDRYPNQHTEVYDLKSSFNIFQKLTEGLNITDNIFEKEKEDYIFCMEETLKQNVSYLFMIEDDAYPYKDMINVLEKILVKQTATRDIYMKDVHYLKFHHPERLLGYISFEVERLAELVSTGLVFGSILSLTCVIAISSTKRSDLFLIWISWVMYVSLIVLTVGRVNVIELRRVTSSLYQLTPAPYCCTQAMLYPIDAARSIIKHLRKMTCKSGFGKDIALEFIRRQEHLKAVMVQPNLFSHNGVYSTVRHSLVNPYLLT